MDCVKKKSFYISVDCISDMPRIFKDKNIGRSYYYKEDYEDSQCQEIFTKKVRDNQIDENYLDG